MRFPFLTANPCAGCFISAFLASLALCQFSCVSRVFQTCGKSISVLHAIGKSSFTAAIANHRDTGVSNFVLRSPPKKRRNRVKGVNSARCSFVHSVQHVTQTSRPSVLTMRYGAQIALHQSALLLSLLHLALKRVARRVEANIYI